MSHSSFAPSRTYHIAVTVVLFLSCDLATPCLFVIVHRAVAVLARSSTHAPLNIFCLSVRYCLVWLDVRYLIALGVNCNWTEAYFNLIDSVSRKKKIGRKQQLGGCHNERTENKAIYESEMYERCDGSVFVIMRQYCKCERAEQFLTVYLQRLSALSYEVFSVLRTGTRACTVGGIPE